MGILLCHRSPLPLTIFLPHQYPQSKMFQIIEIYHIFFGLAILKRFLEAVSQSQQYLHHGTTLPHVLHHLPGSCKEVVLLQLFQVLFYLIPEFFYKYLFLFRDIDVLFSGKGRPGTGIRKRIRVFSVIAAPSQPF